MRFNVHVIYQKIKSLSHENTMYYEHNTMTITKYIPYSIKKILIGKLKIGNILWSIFAHEKYLLLLKIIKVGVSLNFFFIFTVSDQLWFIIILQLIKVSLLFNMYFTDLAFADDIVLIASTELNLSLIHI